MKIALIVVLVLMVLAALILFLELPRRGQRGLEALRGVRYAHRGLHNANRGIPENSLLAFRYAAGGGYGVELDVHLTKDRQLAVVHDSDLSRMCGVEEMVEKRYLQELQSYSLLGTKQRIPSLAEALEVLEGNVPVIVEIKPWKNNYRELCAKVCKVLESYRGPFCVESFDPRVVRWLKRNEPFYIRGQLVDSFSRLWKRKDLPFFHKLMPLLLTNALTRPDFIACRYERRRSPMVWLCTRVLGAQEVVWTVTERRDLSAAERRGALVIFEGFLPGRERREEMPQPLSREELEQALDFAAQEEPEADGPEKTGEGLPKEVPTGEK